MLQLLFGYLLKWFPTQDYLDVGNKIGLVKQTGFILIDSLLQGRYTVFWDHLWHMVLPVLTLGFISLASITRQTRSSMLEVLEQDYIRTARAKGCPERSVINDHALSNALIPTTTIIGLNVAGLLGGAVLTETVFNFNGLGQLMVAAIQRYEIFLISAVVFLMTLIFIVVNMVTDIIYAVLDPRIRLD
jgi:peptide/nickel transport system permease protein